MTDETNPQSNQASDAIMGAVQRRAMEIVALPVEEREERYALILRTNLQAASEMPAYREKHEELARQMDGWIRALVGIIEKGGGSSGGRA